MNKVKKISPYKQVIEPAGKQRVPIIFHVSDELMPDDFTINQLMEVASQRPVFHHVAALTDIHQKVGRRNPSGSVVATENYFLPQLIDTAPNCGMRMLATPFFEDDLDENKIDQLFKKLVRVIPTKTWLGTWVSWKNIIEISIKGSPALVRAFKKDDYLEKKRVMSGGNLFGKETITEKELFTAIPKLFFRFAQFRLGILGAAGNHFLDLMKIDQILDDEVAKKFNLQKGQYLFLMHTGSGLFGQYSGYFYTPKEKEHFSQKLVLEIARKSFLKKTISWHKQIKKEIPRYKNLRKFFAIEFSSQLGKNYFIAHRAAANHGFANRALLQIKLERALQETLKRDPKLEIIYDMPHVFVAKEKHFGKDVLVHRNNTSRAFGPQRMKGVEFFEEIGEPVFLPSSMSTPAYLGVATDENESTFFSAAHGTGKAKKKGPEEVKNKKELLEKMKRHQVRLYNAKSKGIIHQDSANYKDVEKAIEGIKANKIMKPVAKMSPVAVLMA